MRVKVWPAKYNRILQCRRGLTKVYRETIVQPGAKVVELKPLANSTIELVDNGEVVGIYELQFNNPSTIQIEPVDGYVFENEVAAEFEISESAETTGGYISGNSGDLVGKSDEDEPDEDDMEDDVEQDLEEEYEDARSDEGDPDKGSEE